MTEVTCPSCNVPLSQHAGSIKTCAELQTAKRLNADLLDTVKACLVAAGGSDDDAVLQQQCEEAGSKPSHFVRGRITKLRDALEKCFVEMMWLIQQNGCRKNGSADKAYQTAARVLIETESE